MSFVLSVVIDLFVIPFQTWAKMAFKVICIYKTTNFILCFALTIFQNTTSLGLTITSHIYMYILTHLCSVPVKTCIFKNCLCTVTCLVPQPWCLFLSSNAWSAHCVALLMSRSPKSSFSFRSLPVDVLPHI